MGFISEIENSKDSSSFRQTKIQNMFTLCGNYRELSQNNVIPSPAKKMFEPFDPLSSPVRTIDEMSDNHENKQKLVGSQMSKTRVSEEIALDSKENYNPLNVSNDDLVEVYVKWEASKENHGKFITTLRVVKDSSLADIRKLIEVHLGADKQAFTFLILGVSKLFIQHFYIVLFTLIA